MISFRGFWFLSIWKGYIILTFLNRGVTSIDIQSSEKKLLKIFILVHQDTQINAFKHYTKWSFPSLKKYSLPTNASSPLCQCQFISSVGCRYLRGLFSMAYTTYRRRIPQTHQQENLSMNTSDSGYFRRYSDVSGLLMNMRKSKYSLRRLYFHWEITKSSGLKRSLLLG